MTLVASTELEVTFEVMVTFNFITFWLSWRFVGVTGQSCCILGSVLYTVLSMYHTAGFLLLWEMWFCLYRSFRELSINHL